MYPHVPTECETLRDLRKHMRKLWAAVRQGEKPGVDGVFFLKAQECRKDSINLAKRMRVHAQGCMICCTEGALNKEYFYGVYPLPREFSQ